MFTKPISATGQSRPQANLSHKPVSATSQSQPQAGLSHTPVSATSRSQPQASLGHKPVFTLLSEWWSDGYLCREDDDDGIDDDDLMFDLELLCRTSVKHTPSFSTTRK